MSMPCLAIRRNRWGLRNKPAWKLFNAWLAGVPAILGPEAGYRELRRDPLDYLEAGDPDAAMQALARLLDEPGLYPAMVANGTARGADFTVEATARMAAYSLAVLVRRSGPAAAASRARAARTVAAAWPSKNG